MAVVRALVEIPIPYQEPIGAAAAIAHPADLLPVALFIPVEADALAVVAPAAAMAAVWVLAVETSPADRTLLTLAEKLG